ncbi:hypothetical protein RJT34_13731 [Clitoria ternatea]|uniref:DNA-directed RNA polymerase III subunit n=1 Tax=Clitoria ternatea TaxID=43366 RepID=A0AAN9JR84_CLITE
MAGRGRGRGRGGGGGFSTFAPQLPFALFPEDVSLPQVKIEDEDVNMRKLLTWSGKLQRYWKASPYFLEERTSKKSQTMHIARFSDKNNINFTRDSLSQVLMFNEFPEELVKGAAKRRARKKKFRWKPESEVKTLDFFEQQENMNQGKEDNDENEKKDGEEDEDENAEEEDDEDISDDDYNQNEYFDDDEDDYNDVEDGDAYFETLRFAFQFSVP